MKIKGSQGRPRIEWVKAEHPLTAMSDRSDVHANHNESFRMLLSGGGQVLIDEDRIYMPSG
jgi:hypothetical protein